MLKFSYMLGLNYLLGLIYILGLSCKLGLSCILVLSYILGLNCKLGLRCLLGLSCILKFSYMLGLSNFLGLIYVLGISYMLGLSCIPGLSYDWIGLSAQLVEMGKLDGWGSILYSICTRSIPTRAVPGEIKTARGLTLRAHALSLGAIFHGYARTYAIWTKFTHSSVKPVPSVYM